ncbi:hypothetical protein [Bacillus pseudomycoides]
MLQQLREKLWQAIYLNPVWPNDLLDNAKDPHYHGVNFSTSNEGTKVDLVFEDDGKIIKASYHFDSNDYLQKAIMFESNEECILYDRQAQINEISNQIKLYKQSSQTFCIA